MSEVKGTKVMQFISKEDLSTLIECIKEEDNKVREESQDRYDFLSEQYDSVLDEYGTEIDKIKRNSYINAVLVIIAFIFIFILCINTKILDTRLKDLSNLSVKPVEYTTLNPVCPMCHSDSVKLKQLTEDYYIECENCGLHTGYYGNEATLRSDWNSMVDSILTREVE